MVRIMVAALAVAFAWAGSAAAQPIRVGVTICQTGPAASLGIPQRNSVPLLPQAIGGHPVEWIVLDDGSDATRAVANARKLIDENHVDALVGSSISPASLAMIEVAAEKQVPMISLAASSKIIDPPGGSRAWVFKTPQNDSLMADALAESMAYAGVKTVAFIGFNDAYGDGWLAETTRALAASGLTLADTERFSRTDTSVTGQVLKVMAANPDAVLIAGSGTPAALPEKTLRERDYKGRIYQTHGVANADFLRVGGKDVEGTVLPAGPVLVAAQLPAGNPVRTVAQTYVQSYEAVNGPGSFATFGAHIYDAGLLLQSAVPAALTHGMPGTPEFRAALRDALEHLRGVTLTNGVADMTPQDHNGFDKRARVMVTIEDGKWKLLP